MTGKMACYRIVIALKGPIWQLHFAYFLPISLPAQTMKSPSGSSGCCFGSAVILAAIELEQEMLLKSR
jgi:hypothetical protein